MHWKWIFSCLTVKLIIRLGSSLLIPFLNIDFCPVTVSGLFKYLFDFKFDSWAFSSMRAIDLQIKCLISWSFAKTAGTFFFKWYSCVRVCVSVSIYLNWAWNAFFLFTTSHMRQCVVYMNNFCFCFNAFGSLKMVFKLNSWFDWIVVTSEWSYRTHRIITILSLFYSMF